jgi:hypothetical protein
MTYNNAFEIVRESVTAERAAAYYGIEIKRHRANCPFHGGKHFSLSFHGGGFLCFNCQTKGDSIEFVRLLFGYQKPFEAVMRINNDFCLGLDLQAGKPERENHATLKEIQALRELRKKTAERDLPEAVHKILWEYALNLDWVKRMFAPKTAEDEPPELWVYAMQNLSYAEYILDSFDNMTPENQLNFAVKEKEMITEYERLSRFIDGLHKNNAA